MKRFIICLLALLSTSLVFGQHILSYQSYAKGVAEQDTTTIQVIENAKCLKIRTEEKKLSNPVPGYAQSNTYVDYVHDSVYTILDYADGKFYSSYSLTDNDVVFNKEGKEKLLGYDCTKYTTSINSNTIEVWMTESLGFEATPMPGLGRLQGVMVRCMRNGSYITDLEEVKEQKYALLDLIPDNKGQYKSSRELAQLRKDKLVMRIPVFEDAQIHFADYEPILGDIPFDTTLHFSHGTLIVKRMRLPELPAHYQLFAEIHQRSNGDAYDRTASVFVIPTEKAKSFRDGLQRLEALPSFVGKDGKEYQGIKAEKDYLPPVELVRFFTSFGAGHFNENKWSDKPLKEHSIPLFSTCNVMEMSGQNYGRLFATDSLEVEFEIPDGAKNMRLRYISTGHGGWDNGDEFNPKENAIYIDGVKQFTHTPWRCDCATFRDQSPVSGNFWNGVSSSDYSRSGWCPGTATNPVYFDLSGLKPGKHTLRVAIPQGKDEGESFSHWMVSGVLLYEQ